MRCVLASVVVGQVVRLGRVEHDPNLFRLCAPVGERTPALAVSAGARIAVPLGLVVPGLAHSLVGVTLRRTPNCAANGDTIARIVETS